MKRLDFSEAWYGEALPNVPGQPEFRRAVISEGRIQTHYGSIPLLPVGTPRFLRLAPDGIRCAGQEPRDGFDGAWEWDGHGWTVVDPVCCGTSPVIYQPDGRLLVSHCGPVGVQGFRFIDEAGRAWTGDETYASPVYRLYEWTRHGNVVIGQAPTGGAIAINLETGLRVVLEPGDNTRWIRFNRAGDQLAVTIVHQTLLRTVMLWLTVDELALFPKDEDTVIEPDKPPKELPPSSVGVVDGILMDPKAYIESFFARYAAYWWQDVFYALAPHLYKYGLGMQNSSSGVPRGRVYFPHKGCRDVRPRPGEEKLGVRQEPAAWESFVDTVAGDNPAIYPDKTSRWVWERRTGPDYVPLGTVIDPPPPPPGTDLEKRVTVLEAAVGDLRTQVANELAAVRNKIDGFRHDLEQIKGLVLELEAEIVKVRDRKLKVDGSTGRTLGHSHGVRLAVVPE